MQSETGNAAVPTSADVWTAVTTFTVPAGVTNLTKMRFSVAPDWGTSAISVRVAPMFRLVGSGLLEQSPHEYIGQWAGIAMVTSGGVEHDNLVAEYDVDIPVQTGGTFDVQCLCSTEAITAGTVTVNVFYDNNPTVQKNSMSQVSYLAGTTTADAWTTVTTITIPSPAEGSKPTKIRRIGLAVACDQGTTAVALRLSPQFRLTGAGLAEGGNHVYSGAYGGSAEFAAAAGAIAQNNGTAWIAVDVPINAGGQILVEHLFVTETPTASSVGVCLVYE